MTGTTATLTEIDRDIASRLVSIIQISVEMLRRLDHGLARETVRGELADLDLARQSVGSLECQTRLLDFTLINGGRAS